jgi:hypothetical protein
MVWLHTVVFLLFAQINKIVMSEFSFTWILPYSCSCVKMCQVPFSHFVTLAEDSAAPGSHNSRIVVQRLGGIFCIMEESKVIVLCLCVHKNKTCSVNTRKANKIRNDRQPIDWLRNSMQFRPLWEALAYEPSLHTLSNPKVHHMCNNLPHVPILSHISPIHVCHPVSWRSVLMLSTLLYMDLPNDLSVWVFQAKATRNSCCHAVMHCSTWLCPVWEPLWLSCLIHRPGKR